MPSGVSVDSKPSSSLSRTTAYMKSYGRPVCIPFWKCRRLFCPHKYPLISVQTQFPLNQLIPEGSYLFLGKTFVTGLLGAMAVDDGFAVGMVKPVSSSAVPFPECVTMDEDNYNVDLESKDATHLMRSAGIPESRRHEVNPYAIAGDFSPRLAAELSGKIGRAHV